MFTIHLYKAMKILIYYTVLLFLSLPLYNDSPSFKFVQVSVENDSKVPDHEKENEDIESFPDESCINNAEKISCHKVYPFFTESFTTMPGYKKNWWIQTVFAPPEAS